MIGRDEIIGVKNVYPLTSRLICELLKVNVLVPPVLEMCVAKLAESSKETSIE
jgi:hypothetical protein